MGHLGRHETPTAAPISVRTLLGSGFNPATAVETVSKKSAIVYCLDGG